jgi:hypothetical protein
MSTNLEIPRVPVDKMSNEQVMATPQYRNLIESPVFSVLGEAALIKHAKRFLKDAQKTTRNLELKTPITALFESADRQKLWDGVRGDKIIVYRAGHYHISQNSTKFSTANWVSLIGRTVTRTVTKAGAKKRTDAKGNVLEEAVYSLKIRGPRKTRKDVKFSLEMTCPNGTVMRYPAQTKGEPGANEADKLSAFLKESQAEQSASPQQWFKLFKELKAASDDADASDDDENDDDDDENENENDLDSMLDDDDEDDDED